MINAGADAVIVASAIINIIKNYTDGIDNNSNNKKKEEMLKNVRIFVSSMKKSCK
jgi:tryptophan synthase alpha subunit